MKKDHGADVAFSYASGKIIIGGEHAVVYGHPAIAATLDRGVRIAVTALSPAQNKTGPMLRSTGLGFVGQVCPDPGGEGPDVLRKALNRLVELCGEKIRSLELVVDSAIPGGRGLGSSAALSVAMVRGVLRYFEQEAPADEVARLALELEKIFHGNPSGIDHTVIARGGMIQYQKTETGVLVESIRSPRELTFVVALSGAHGGTLQAVSALKQRAKRYPHLYESIFKGIADVVVEMRSAIDEGRLAALGELMNLNQGYLNALSLSTPEIEKLCALAREKGALGAKLTGAGGGGAVIALVDGNAESLVQSFSESGYLSFTSRCQTE